MDQVRSADGTQIACRSIGEGPPLVLVHGTGTTSGDWVGLLPFLRSRFTVVTMDRRGRGRSGDGPEYSMEREAEDVLAVLEAVDGELLVGHSYGGLCSMVAAARTERLRRLVLYEPPIAVPERWAQGVRDRVEGGDGEQVLSGFLAAVGMGDDQLAAIRSSAAWPVLLGTVSTLPRELLAAADWPVPEGPLDVPTLYLVGADTTNRSYLDGLGKLLTRFTDVTHEELPGQLHVAHVFAAEAFAERIAAFCA